MRDKILTKYSVLRYFFAKKSWIMTKNISPLSRSFVYTVCMNVPEVFTTHFNTRCQMVTLLLYCTCMMVLWSAVAPALKQS